jgi:hypothetical protein
MSLPIMMQRILSLSFLLLAFSSAEAAIRAASGLSIPQHGGGGMLSAVLYAPDQALWTPPYPLVTMLPGGGAEISSVEWAAQALAGDGYMVVIPKPELGGSAQSYHLAARSGIDFLLSSANPYLAEADTQHIGACGWSLGGRALSRTQEEDLRLDCIVAWDNLAISENGDAGSPSGGFTPVPLRTPRVPAMGQASELGNTGSGVKITAWNHWRSHRVPCAEVVFATGSTAAAHLKWGTLGTSAEHDRFHHYTRAWLDRWLKGDRMGTERLLISTLAGTAASSYLSSSFFGGLYADGYDSADLRSLITQSSTSRTFTPSTAEPAISGFNSAHYAYRNTASTARDRLLVFLPGTGALPFNYRQILRCAADRGFHALGLMYVNSPSVGELTATEPPDAAGKVRLEIIDGTDRTPLVSVNRVNSIEHRLITALTYLQSQAPAENWAQFLSNGLPRWDRILISGHSQGGGHSGMMAKQWLVSRCLMFNAGDWSPTAGRPADWLYSPSATPVQRQYGIGHLDDPLLSAANLRLQWQALGLPSLGAETAPETWDYPHAYTHQFMTDLDPSDTSSTQNFHGATVADSRVPLDTFGIPLLKPFWAHLLLSSHIQPQASFDGTTLSIPTTAGIRYQAQTSSNLRSWTDQGALHLGTGTTATHTIIPTSPAQFWRWQLVE